MNWPPRRIRRDESEIIFSEKKGNYSMTKKKRYSENCSRHPGKPARGRCAVCGKSVCDDCSVIIHNNRHCISYDCLPGEIKDIAGGAPKNTSPPADGPIRVLIYRSAVTAALCGLVFAAWTVREVSRLKSENRLLRTSRLALIEQIKKSNRRIESITEAVPGDDNEKPDFDSISSREAETKTSSEKHSPPFTQSLKADNPVRENTRYHFVNGSLDRKTVALTFDGGSTANAAEAILDTLASRSVRATMFLTGEFIRKFPEITKRIVAEGHECGNHTYSHPHLTRYSIDRTSVAMPNVNELMLREELLRTERLFRETTGIAFSPIWRAPYGEFNQEICRIAYEAGYLHIGWRQGKTWREGLDSNDWITDSQTAGYHTPEEFIDKVVALAWRKPYGINGGILLFHLGSERKEPKTQVHRVLGALIDTLRNEGYSMVTVSEMASQAGFDMAGIRGKADIQ